MPNQFNPAMFGEELAGLGIDPTNPNDRLKWMNQVGKDRKNLRMQELLRQILGIEAQPEEVPMDERIINI